MFKTSYNHRLVQLFASRGRVSAVLTLLALLISGSLSNVAIGRDSSATSPDARLETKLTQKTSLTFTGVPIRDALMQLAAAHDVVILLDRRIDPSRHVNLETSDAALGDVIAQIAAAGDAGVAHVASVVYVGPPEWAAVVRTAATLFRDELSALPRSRRRSWQDERVWRWPELSTPQDLIAEVGRAAHSRIDGTERVPHDLWPAADLGRLEPCDVLSLLAIQFALRASVDEETHHVTLVDLDPGIKLRRSYEADDPSAAARQWRELASDARVEVTSTAVVVEALAEAHDRYRSLAGADASDRTAARSTSPARRRHKGDRTYTLQLKNAPLEQVLEALNGQLIPLVWDRDELAAAGIALDQSVGLDVSDATVDEILSSVLEPVGLKYRIDDGVCHITPAKPPAP